MDKNEALKIVRSFLKSHKLRYQEARAYQHGTNGTMKPVIIVDGLRIPAKKWDDLTVIAASCKFNIVTHNEKFEET